MFSELFLNLYRHRLRLHNLPKMFIRCKSMRIFDNYCSAKISYFFNISNFDASILHRSCFSRSNQNKSVKLNTSSIIHEKMEMIDEKNEKMSSIDYVFKHSVFKERCVYRIIQALQCSRDEALRLYKNLPFLFCENIDCTLGKITFLKNAGVPGKYIVKNREILELNKDEIISKINELDSWGLNGQQKGEVLIFLNLENELFTKMSTLYKREKNEVPKGNRLIHFSEMLQCSLEELVKNFFRYPHLFFRDFEKLNKTLKMLLDIGISTQMIMKNIRLGLFNAEVIQSYLRTTEKHNKLELNQKSNRVFLLRFQRIVKNGKSEKLILRPDKTRAEFLSEKLNVDLKIVEYLMLKHSVILNGNLEKMSKNIEFLFSVGYTGKQICTYPRVLKMDIACLQKRILELKCCGESKPYLYIVSQTNRKYQKHLHVIIEMNKD